MSQLQLLIIIIINWLHCMFASLKECEVITKKFQKLNKKVYSLVISKLNDRIVLPCILNEKENKRSYRYKRWMQRQFGNESWSFVKIKDGIRTDKCSSLIFESVKRKHVAMYGCFTKKYTLNYLKLFKNYYHIPIFFLDLQSPSKVIISNSTSFNWQKLNEIFKTIDEPIDAFGEQYLTNIRATIRYLPEPWSSCYPCGQNHTAYRSRLVRCLIARVEKQEENEMAIIYIPIFGCQSSFVKYTYKLFKNGDLPNYLDIEQCTPPFCVDEIIEQKAKLKNFDFRSFILSFKKKSKIFKADENIIPLELPRGQVFEFEGWKIELKCPKVKYRDGKVYWYKNSQLIKFKKIKGRRIFTNERGDLILKNLQVDDSGVYTCVQNDVQKASSQIIVKKYVHRYDVRNPEVAMEMASFVVTIIFFGLIFYKIYFKKFGYTKIIA